MGLDSILRSFLDAGWSSLVARQAHNLKAVGSNPTPATNFSQDGWKTFTQFTSYAIR